MLTGCHGLHVLVGTVFLLVQTRRLSSLALRPRHHNGLTFAIWYWHFVDVVWLGLYVRVYWFGSFPGFAAAQELKSLWKLASKKVQIPLHLLCYDLSSPD